MPLYPWLLALNDPEKPAGEVLGLGLVNWRDCIGEWGGGASEGGQREFYDSKGDNSFMSIMNENTIYPYYIKMSVYPVLEASSLSQRCERDIGQFMREQNIQVNPNLQKLLTTFSRKEEIEAKINELKPKFDQGDAVMYVDEISHVEDPTKQQQLWIARTYLVYQLLIVLTLSLTNSDLYNNIFLTEPIGNTSSMFAQPFRSEVSEFLSNIKLGIFGSLTPTSDIDIGFQYSGFSESYTPCLAYIVSRFEILFLIFTKKRCLDFDVESYADMITVPNPDSETQSAFPDLFYLDTGKLHWDDKNTQRSLLPIAFNSIVRNVMIGLGVEQEFNLSGVISQFESSLPKYLTDLKIDQDANNDFEASKQRISTFLGKSYNDQIQEYYDAVNVAEILKVTTLKDKTTIVDELQQLSNDEIIKLIVNIGQALTLRMESYTCSPTVVHVVRVLQVEAQLVPTVVPTLVNAFTQARKEPSIQSPSAAPSAAPSAQPNITENPMLALPTKYVTTAPGNVCELDKKLATPRCVVGKTGFILSALEQLGYMYRFHKTYCEGGTHPDPKKCEKKMGKYQSRLNHAITNLKTAQGGGKRVNRRTYMKHSSMKSSSHYNHKPKTKKRHFKTVKKQLYKKYRNSKKMKRAYMKKNSK